jgi:hypothetical protein
MWQNHGAKINRGTIHRWIRDYSYRLHRFLSRFEPRLRGSIHVDEVIVKVKGRNGYSWGAIDRRTRFKVQASICRHQTTPWKKQAPIAHPNLSDGALRWQGKTKENAQHPDQPFSQQRLPCRRFMCLPACTGSWHTSMSPKPQNMARRFDVTSLLFGSSTLPVQDHLTTQESAMLDRSQFHFVAMSGGIPQRKKAGWSISNSRPMC